MIQPRRLPGGTAMAFSSLLVAASTPGLSAPVAGPQEPAPAAVAALRSKSLAMVARQLVPRNVTSTPDQNEWNPRFSPDGRQLSFERREGSAQAIFVADTGSVGGVAERVSSRPPRRAATAEETLLGGGDSDDSFNTQLSFHPDGSRYVFVGNAGTGVYHLYEGRLGGSPPRALAAESREDGHPAISPDGRWLVYVSARAGVGKLFLRDLTTGLERPLTGGDKVDLFPAWSPDSRSVAYTSGDNDNHDVFVIPDVSAPAAAPRQLTTWKFDDLRPTFSPDGVLVAFYSNYSPTNQEKEWSIVAVPADGSGPTKGALLAKLTAGVNVVKDPEVGPAWLPWGRALVYARDQKAEWNPIYAVDTETGEELRIETPTRMNHDLTCSRNGLLAFRAQVASWDDIFVAPLRRVP
jgi:dipeptidyl aminopeptidase/acylaminoacyl peptidase